MEVRNIPSDRKAGQCIASSSIAHIGRDRPDDLHSFGFGGINDRTSADTVDSNAINQVSVTPLLSSTDVSREETKCSGSERGETEPTNLGGAERNGSIRNPHGAKQAPAVPAVQRVVSPPTKALERQGQVEGRRQLHPGRAYGGEAAHGTYGTPPWVPPPGPAFPPSATLRP